MKKLISKHIKRTHKSIHVESLSYFGMTNYLYISLLVEGGLVLPPTFRKVEPLEKWGIKELLDLWLRVMWLKIFKKKLVL